MTTANNSKLTKAKKEKNDEFYTQCEDIEKEINAYINHNENIFRDKVVLLPCDDPTWSNFTKYFVDNFYKLGLKKLISTCIALASEDDEIGLKDDFFNDTPKGKIFIMNKGDVINSNEIPFKNLKGNGDFRSQEITHLRNEADFIITNPPFSLFREFLAWVVEADKKFALIGNMNAITYKEVFPLIKDNKIWLGATGAGKDMVFSVPEGVVIADADRQKAARQGYVGNYTRLGNSTWFTSIEYGARHKPLPLKTMNENLTTNKQLIKKLNGLVEYQVYDNYNAIDVPFTNAIPSDYDGVMGVPISFLDKYCPEQFEIIKFRKGDDDRDLSVNGMCPYFRILIKHK